MALSSARELRCSILQLEVKSAVLFEYGAHHQPLLCQANHAYRGRRLAKGPSDGFDATQDQEDDDNSDDQLEGTAKKAWALAVFQKRKEWLFQRTCVLPGLTYTGILAI